MTFPLRPFLPTDTVVLAEIFREAIYELARSDYDEDQLMAWMGLASDEDDFGARLESQLTLVALDAGEPAAFISIKDNTQIDMIYVLPGFAREGAGSTLMDAAIKISTARGAEALTAEVTDNAKAFFEHFGFVGEKRGMLDYNDEILGVTFMRKPLKNVANPPATDAARDKIMRGKS